MRWRPTDPVQEVGAVIVTGPAAVARLADAMMRKSSLIQSLPVVHGPAWAVVFAAPLSSPARDGEDRVLPRLEGATPLYEAAPGCWLPVGAALDAPDHALPALWRMILDHYAVTPPIVLVPRAGSVDGSEIVGDLYPIRDPVAFAQSALNRRRPVEAAR